MTCKDCIHEDLCMDKFKKQYPSYANKNITVDDCEHFKNKVDFVEVKKIEIVRDGLKWWLVTNTEQGVVHIPEFVIKNMIANMDGVDKTEDPCKGCECLDPTGMCVRMRPCPRKIKE